MPISRILVVVSLVGMASVVLGVTGCGSKTKTGSSVSGPLVTGESGTNSLSNPESFRGTFFLDGEVVTDHCDGTIYLAAKKLKIDLGRHLFQVDVVDRSYELEALDGELVARGVFDRIDSCGTHEFVEVWRLRPSEDGGLTGQLTTYHRGAQARDCLRACKFVSAIRATLKPLPTEK